MYGTYVRGASKLALSLLFIVMGCIRDSYAFVVIAVLSLALHFMRFIVR